MGIKGSTFCFGCKGSTFMNEQIAGMDSFTSNFHFHYYVFFTNISIYHIRKSIIVYYKSICHCKLYLD